ncbi:MAG: hypothetical protein COT45_01730 [bacterium (Candidatus Stahlbacteria) CG08_land_8_20_14_0_20_40_26]|nr:MAG: hypothetical protein COX49_08260 [bacterium (Candidatus Stahlbacteria) CG23_combo_of_CG06-09_8_20_14_all_40_9]PIS25854.1 MAG: hypothetical protein COT45_01730 [bacterium (Candidatus Stahlbacteria) CG08_land_8_20_14_0_20_40_26]
MNENEQLKKWLTNSKFKNNHNEFARYVGAPNATVWGWLNRDSKISKKYRKSLYLITKLDCFIDSRDRKNDKKVNISKIDKFIDTFEELIALLKYFEEATPEEREFLRNSLDNKRHEVAYINNLLRLIFDEYKFQEWKRNNEFLK